MPPELEQIRVMAGALTHRGPDEFGVYRDSLVGLAHARLSIIDLAGGRQPLANEDETLWISFNGEIFNYIELRQELIEAGHLFRTNSDTEVIVHAFEEWGNDAFGRFNGQWAVALWDSSKKVLTLARDRYGICPLHYCEYGGRLYFGSEVKAIFSANSAIPREFDPVGLDQTFTFWSIVPPQSVYRGVSEVVPGHVRSYSIEGVSDYCYWQPRFPGEGLDLFSGSFEEAVEALDHTLGEATRLRIERSDVQVGSYLSGGLDSSIVAALGRRYKHDDFRTFSLQFKDAEFDETEYQKLMVDHLGTQHSEMVVSQQDVADVFPSVISHTERPVLRTAPAPLFKLSGLVNDSGIKVVLTGEGADEMFAGYDIFREAKVRRFWARQPQSAWRPRLIERLYPYLARSPVNQREMAKGFFGRNLETWKEPGFSHQLRWQTTSAVKRFYSSEQKASLASVNVVEEFLGSLPEAFGSWSFLAQDQYLETRTLLSGYLLSSQGDRMLSAHSVEGRYPFLDSDVIDFANSLPASYKLKVLDEKHILKKVAENLIPDSVRERKKQPYRAPDAVSFVGGGTKEWVRDILSPDAVRDAGVFNPKAVAQLLKKCERLGDTPHRYSNTDNMSLVGVISTQLIYKQYIEGESLQPRDVKLTTCVDRL